MTQPNNKFTHLHTHTHYSLLNALPKIPAMVEKAKEYGMESLAITDDGNLYAAVEFYKACNKAEIKPIIGVDFFVAARSRFDKVSGIDNRRSRLVLLAKNNNGYRNLIKLVSDGHKDGFYYKPRIDRELLEKYGEDLVCIIPQFSGETSQSLQLNNIEKAEEALSFFKGVFKDDLYMEILHHPEIDGQEELKEKIVKFAGDNNVEVVATGDTYYLNPEDKKARDVLVDVGNIRQGGSMHRENEDFSFHDMEYMAKTFSDYPNAIENTQVIADKCNAEIELGNWAFPTYPIESGKSADQELRDIVYANVEPKGFELTDEIKERIEYELDVISTKGYSVYFIVVADLITHSKANDIYTNTRGSAAGSLVSYLLDVTTVDPIKYKLPFERFLNPGRPSLPDIDLDIAEDKRDELIAYTREKYGQDAVAQIGTFGTMAARGAVKDAARAMGYEYQMGDKISKLIPMGKQGFPMFIDRALEEEEDFKKLYNTDAEVKKIVDMAKKIEGCARHISVHAAGVVISPTVVTDYTPTQVDQKSGKIITQFSMYPVEEAGLVKFDFLGLKNLTILREAVRRIKKTRGEDIDVYNLPLDNEPTFKMLAEGHTEGVFQLASAGMTKWIKELRPTTIEDINAMVALYRPGPMEFIPEYIRRKYNPSLITYPDPRTEPYLKGSYGLLIYQDDIMQLAVDLAGYTWLEADLFRKAMGKKIPELMAEQEVKFKDGLKASKIDEKTINEMWDNIVTFAAYGFNKGHAAAYGKLSYMTAYMKANYPAEYMAAVLTADSGDNERIARASEECKVMEIPVLPPDVNESFEDFGVAVADPNKEGDIDRIRFGLRTIKNFGDNISEAVVEERKKNGVFKNLEDFLNRIKSKDLNKKSIQALTLSGAFDSLEDRNAILANSEEILKFCRDEREKNENQDSLFSMMEGVEMSALKLEDPKGKHVSIKTGMNDELHYTLPMTKKDQLFWEKELLGLYVSGHPLDKYRHVLEKDGKNIESIKASGRKGNNMIAGVIDELKIITTEKGQRMAFVKISDFTGSIETVFFPEAFKENEEFLTAENILAVSGKLNDRDNDGNLTLLVDKVKILK